LRPLPTRRTRRRQSVRRETTGRRQQQDQRVLLLLRLLRLQHLKPPLQLLPPLLPHQPRAFRRSRWTAACRVHHSPASPSLTRPKWHTLGDMFCVANGVKLDNGWVPYSNSLSFRFAKDAHGIVHLGGLIKSGLPDANKAVLTLPVGFRCPRWEHVSANGGCEFGEVLIRHSGDIYVRTKGRANDWISFDGISFSTV